MVYGERQIIKEPTEIERQTEGQTDNLKIHKRGRNKHEKMKGVLTLIQHSIKLMKKVMFLL